MNIPVIQGIIRRRLLLNYRIAPEAIAQILPGNFRPKMHRGFAIGGVCLIRLEQIRPSGLPSFVGISSENSAHRIAVDWTNAEGQTVEGVYVPRRDTDSRLNSLAGGRVFPGVHHRSAFTVNDRAGEISIRIDAEDTTSPLIEIKATESGGLPETSIFSSLEESSRFFEAGRVGYSSCPNSRRLDGLMLKVANWQVSPLKVDRIQSAYFDNRQLFPENQITFDHALLMRDIDHEWHSEPELEAEMQLTMTR